MIKSITEKRIDEIEIKLTPKEWVIRFVDEMQKYPSETSFLKAMAKDTSRESLILKPFLMLSEQAEERFSGKKPENIRARNQLSRKLQTEWHMLKNLIFTINKETNNQAESTGLKTALKLSTLQTFVLQDVFKRTAENAAKWIGKCKTTADDEEKYRQIILKELDAFRDLYLGEIFGQPFGSDIRIRFSVPIEGLIIDITMLISDIFAHEAAIKIIQDKYFDGHPILFQDAENKFVETIKMVRNLAATFSEYLKIRESLFKAEGNQDDQIISALASECKGQLTIDIEAIKFRAVEQSAIALANAWIKFEREKAVAEFLEEPGEYETYIWGKFRESFGLSLCGRTHV
jgi:hypothetical protein